MVCHIIAFTIEFKILRENIHLQFDKKKLIVKPVLATIMMGIVSYTFYQFTIGTLGNRITTILTLMLAVIVYIISVILLHVFSKEEIFRLPYGEKIYIFLKKARLYRKA